jgi:aldose 1-epimerase
MEKREFGTTAEGKQATLYTIKNENGMQVKVTDFGAALVSILVQDRNGMDVDVILGYDDVTGYQNGTCYFGATVGRNCNRIANARLTIDGETYTLEANDNENNLHSGSQGTSARLWELAEHTDSSLTLQIEDAHLQQGYPGNAKMQVTFTVTPDNALEITYQAKADQKTVFNMTNHAYFNLNGAGSGSILYQNLQLAASAFTPTDAKSIPSGEIRPVEDTPFDFREAKTIGRDIAQEDEQLLFGKGYDHNYVLDKTHSGVEKIATACSRDSGIRMDVSTDCPGIQFYTGNFVDGELGKEGHVYEKRDAFCLETQYFPNSVNEPGFATPFTNAGELYESRTIYAFSVENA